MSIPKKVTERIASGLKRLVPIILQQKTRDVSEADTVTLVKDVLSEVFGYDKYSELTGELAIRGTYCDLAIRLDEKVVMLIEVKAIGITLNDRHLKQAVDYAANQGVEWIILTNAVNWRLYHVLFSKPIDKQLIAEVDITASDIKQDHDLELLYLMSRDGYKKGAPIELRDKQDATSRFLLAAVLLNNESVLGVFRRELRRVVDVLVSDEDIIRVLSEEVIKRDVLEGPPAEVAAGRVRRVAEKAKRQEAAKAAEHATEEVVASESSLTPVKSPPGGDIPPESQQRSQAAPDQTNPA